MLKQAAVIVATLGALAGGIAWSQAPKGPLDRDISASLDGNKEIPPTATSARGDLKGIVTMANKVVRWTVSCSGLSGPVTAMHFHGPASEDKNANVALPMEGDCTNGPVSGEASLNDGQFSDLLAGKWYVNIHTAQYPNGEIRGQVAVIRRGD